MVVLRARGGRPGTGVLGRGLFTLMAVLTLMASAEQDSEVVSLAEDPSSSLRFETRVLKEAKGTQHSSAALAPEKLSNKHDSILALQSPEVMRKVPSLRNDLSRCPGELRGGCDSISSRSSNQPN